MHHSITTGLIFALLLQSCYITQYSQTYTRTGNRYTPALGKSKTEVMRMFGVPDRVLDDGSGGEILVYEKFTQTTTSTANSATYGGSNTNGAVVGGGAGIIGNVHSQNAQVTAGAATTNTTTTKTFLNLFINSDGEVYDFKASDSGETYSVSNTSTRCFSKLYTWTSVGASCLLIWPALITVPWAIIAQRKAKQNDQVCP